MAIYWKINRQSNGIFSGQYSGTIYEATKKSSGAGSTIPAPEDFFVTRASLFSYKTESSGLLSGSSSILWSSHLFVDLSQGFIGENERWLKGNSLLGCIKSFIVAFHLTIGIGQIIIIISINRIPIDGVLIVLNSLIILVESIIGCGQLVVALWIVFKLTQ